MDKIRMIDIGGKKEVKRRAMAFGKIYLKESTIEAIKEGRIEKGNVLATAKVSGIMAVKRTSDTIPLCHPIPITNVEINFELDERFIRIKVLVESLGRTGVEMEALHGVNISLLTIWDMVKSVEKDENGQYPETEISDIKVVYKEKDV
ncbi:MAG: cyclic pyranopterin monophosphate synthase MoaC [Candidatus Methanolliviera hydrocarbonicum]|uniref:Probable cyclic pyranopterin monophosphate synthase n=1 Tax=Candidatus Methanolliviera hydrocarbonicum TaxID=2491085 RepID=A0A520KVW8_9EURY|nr:MAG: cyclic pyranopterin monophosphate synthase MoaC [Candidatus Methanolliviera hydrocarbonicum]